MFSRENFYNFCPIEVKSFLIKLKKDDNSYIYNQRPGKKRFLIKYSLLNYSKNVFQFNKIIE